MPTAVPKTVGAGDGSEADMDRDPPDPADSRLGQVGLSSLIGTGWSSLVDTGGSLRTTCEAWLGVGEGIKKGVKKGVGVGVGVPPAETATAASA